MHTDLSSSLALSWLSGTWKTRRCELLLEGWNLFCDNPAFLLWHYKWPLLSFLVPPKGALSPICRSCCIAVCYISVAGRHFPLPDSPDLGPFLPEQLLFSQPCSWALLSRNVCISRKVNFYKAYGHCLKISVLGFVFSIYHFLSCSCRTRTSDLKQTDELFYL